MNIIRVSPLGILCCAAITCILVFTSCQPDQNQLAKKIEEELRPKIKEEVKAELSQEILEEIKAELMASIRADFKEELESEILKKCEEELLQKLQSPNIVKTSKSLLKKDLVKKEKIKNPPKPVVQDKKGLTFTRHLVATGINKREPVAQAKNFTANTKELYCFVEANNKKGQLRKVTSVWYLNDREHFRFRLTIGRSTAWKTWAKYTLDDRSIGQWRCDIINEKEEVISRTSFSITKALP